MLDIRYPIGLMFVFLGAVLAIYGLVSDPKIYQLHSFGINVNLGWGLVLMIFGAFMLTLAQRKRSRTKAADPKSDITNPQR
jgi:hypothetical protein